MKSNRQRETGYLAAGALTTHVPARKVLGHTNLSEKTHPAKAGRKATRPGFSVEPLIPDELELITGESRSEPAITGARGQESLGHGSIREVVDEDSEVLLDP